MSLVSRHPLVLQTAFADLKRQADEQPFLLPGSPGSVGKRTVEGRDYWYRQFYDARGRKAAEYLGPVGDPAGDSRKAAVEEQIELTRGLLEDSRILAREGYVRADPRTGSILAALANRALFSAGAVLVGSHAFGALLNQLGVASAPFSTEDVDIARGKPLELALPDDVGLLEILRESTVPLHPIPELDSRRPSTSYKPPGRDRLRVDLLVPARGNEIEIREVRELKAHATALPHLGFLLEETVATIVIGRESVVPVRVPAPARFALHKMLVSELRGPASEKRTKDAWQAAVLVASLADEAPDELLASARALPASARRLTRAGAARARAALEREGEERGLEMLEEVSETL